MSLNWRPNERNGVSNHQPHNCLLNRLFRHISKKTSKLRVTGLCAENSPETGEFPAQMASNAENATHVRGMELTTLGPREPHGLNCRPGPCEGVAGAMSASRVVCKVVQLTVKQRQLHASPPANKLSWLLEPKFLATPAIGSSQSRVEVNLSRQRRFEV